MSEKIPSLGIAKCCYICKHRIPSKFSSHRVLCGVYHEYAEYYEVCDDFVEAGEK